MAQPKQIDPAVALGEEQVLTQYLKLRTLSLAQDVADLRAENAALKSQVEGMKGAEK